MANLSIRNIDDDDLERFAAYARANNRSVAAELRQLIAEAPLRKASDAAVSAVLEFRKKYPLKLRPGEDSVAAIRAIRDEE